MWIPFSPGIVRDFGRRLVARRIVDHNSSGAGFRRGIPIKPEAMIWFGLPLVLLAPPAIAQDEPKAFLGASILPISGPPVENGVLLIHKGRIVAVGSSAEVTIPPDAEQIDLAGRTILPGLVDTHSHIAEVEGADSSAPIQPEVRVLDAINVRDSRIRKARAGGVTTVNVMPGSGHLLSGQTLYLKLRDARVTDDLLIPLDDGAPAGGVKMANGTNSRRPTPFPGTRARSAALIRERFIKAIEYREKLADAGDDPGMRPPRDLGLEALVEVLEGRRVVHHHTHRFDDILTVLRLREEFGFKVVLHHVSDAWKVAGEIAAAGVPSSIIMIDSPGGKLEAQDVSFRNGKALEDAGAAVAFHSDDPITDSRLLLRSAALAVRAGMSREKALESLTLAAARMLDLEDRVGSLEPGKDADFVVLSGDPLSVYTQVLQTWVEGRRVFDLEDPEDYLHAVGGYGAGLDQPRSVEAYLAGEVLR
jgi:imidazolonepropionase-like amidohydrolase